MHSPKHVFASLEIMLALFEMKQQEQKINLRKTVLSVSDVGGMRVMFIC